MNGQHNLRRLICISIFHLESKESQRACLHEIKAISTYEVMDMGNNVHWGQLRILLHLVEFDHDAFEMDVYQFSDLYVQTHILLFDFLEAKSGCKHGKTKSPISNP